MTIKELYEKKMQEMQKERSEEIRLQLLAQQKREYEKAHAQRVILDALEGLSYEVIDSNRIKVETNPPISITIDVCYRKVKFSDDCELERTLCTDIKISGHGRSVTTGLNDFEDAFVKFLLKYNIKVN